MNTLRNFSLVGEYVPEEVIGSFIKNMPNVESISIKSSLKRNMIYSLVNTLPRTVRSLKLGKIAEPSELVVESLKKKNLYTLRKLHLELDKSCVLNPEQVIDLLNIQSNELEDILISGIDFCQEFIAQELRKRPALRRITFRRLANYDPPPIKFWEIIFKNFGEQLTHLHIEDGMLPENLGDLIGTYCTNLVDFSARNTTMDTPSITQLVKKVGDSIRVLNLSQTEIDPMVFVGVFLRCQGERLLKLRVDGLPVNNMLFQMLSKTSTDCLEVLSFTEN